MNRPFRLLAAASVAILANACASQPAEPPARWADAKPPEAAPVTPARPKAQVGTFGFDTTAMNREVAPGDDFFDYANGAWVQRTEIPADRSSLSTFAVLAERAAQRTRAIIEDPGNATAAAGTEARQIGDYYASFMDEAAIEAAGVSPIKPALAQIEAIKTRSDLSRVIGTTIRADTDALNATEYHTPNLFGLWVAEDLNDTTKYRPYLMQGGLVMPDREYYLGDSARYQELRGKYRQHIANMLRLAGYSDVDARAARVLALETAIAKAHWTVDQSSNVPMANTVWTRAELARKAPGMDWNAFLASAGLGGQDRFGAWQNTAIAGISKLVGSQPIQAWRDYLAFHQVERAAPYLSKAFVDENFAFTGQALSGTPQQRERWKRGVDATSNALGEAIGKLYVQRHFSPEAKAQVEAMVKNILTAFGQRIDRLDWMTPQTKAEARKKLANFQVSVGYPDRWRDYSGLEIRRGDPWGNQERAELFELRRNIAKLGQPVDRHEWFMTPQTVNALFAPSQNSISFPAAILEPTFFDPNADPAINYGAIGAVIGHEISHGFDDTGAVFDAEGNLKNWWTPQDMAQFKARTKRLADQYSAYQVFPDLKLNGEQVLGENIADVAGLSTAYDAWKLSLNGQEAPVIDGFTGEQRFFMGFAQNYRSKAREAALRRQVVTDVHSPGRWRSYTVRNIDAWYPAFDVKPGQKLYLAPDARVRIW